MSARSRREMLLAASAAALTACSSTQSVVETQARPKGPSLGGVRQISTALGDLVPEGAMIEELGAGYQWAEGPIWVENGQYLLFSDVPGNCMYKWSEAEGVAEFMKPSGFAGADASHLREGGSNGLTLDAMGRLVYADTGNRNITRMDLATRQKTVVVDRFEGKHFNSPNDLIIHSNGAIYFTDPPYGLAGIMDSPLREIGFNGVFRLDPSGRIDVIERELKYPNGIALSPDQRTLYVSCSDPDQPIIKSYDLGDDGLPTANRILFDAKSLQSPDAPGNPDGMTVDVSGRLFATGPGGVMIITPQGELLGIINPGRGCANCKFGEDGSTLFLTAHDKLGRIRLNTKGIGWA